MAAESGQPNPRLVPTDIEQKLWREPFSFDFFQAVRLLQWLHPDHPQVGRAARPSEEIVRFQVNPSLGFPASAILFLGPVWKSELEEKGEDPNDPDMKPVPLTPEQQQLLMTVNFMGAVGPMGTLPIYYTQLIGSEAAAGNKAPRDYLDLFHHRIISLFYLAWEKYRYLNRSDITILTSLYSLIGMGTEGLRNRPEQVVPDAALASYAGLLSQQPRSAVALRNILVDYFGVAVEIEQFIGCWYRLDPQDQSALDAGEQQTYQLARGAVLGDEVWEPQALVRVSLGPLNRQQYLSFLPSGSAYRELQGLLRFFGNEEFDFDLRLILEREETPGCVLGAEGNDAPRLGWLSWVKNRDFSRDPNDALVAI